MEWSAEPACILGMLAAPFEVALFGLSWRRRLPDFERLGDRTPPEVMILVYLHLLTRHVLGMHELRYVIPGSRRWWDLWIRSEGLGMRF